MKRIGLYAALGKLGRVRLSRHFVMRDFLHSEITNFYGLRNLPDDPELAIAAGTRLAIELLEPLIETFGPIAIHSAYRSPEVNALGNRNGHNCARNEASHAGHIWDRRDASGHMGVTACIVIPWFAEQYEAGRDWRDLAWWLHDPLPCSALQFFPVHAAFNLTWSERPRRAISSFIAPRGNLLAAGTEPAESLEQRRQRYADFPPFRGIALPQISARWGKNSPPEPAT